MSESEILYDILINHRLNTVKFLENNNDFEKISELLKEIIWRHPTESIKKLLLGKSGMEYNKQMAIPYIPTKEYMHIIAACQYILELGTIVEIDAGMGLFSKLYKKYISEHTDLFVNETTIRTLCEKTYLETSPNIKLESSENISLGELIIRRIDMSNSLCTLSLVGNDSHIVKQFLNKCRPKCLIISCNTKHGNDYIQCIENSSYCATRIDVQMISYLDHFVDGNNNLHSCVIIMYDRSYSDFYITEKYILDVITDIFMIKKPITYTNTKLPIDTLFSDCVANDMIPKWTLALDTNTKTEILTSIKKALTTANDTIVKKFFTFLSSNIDNMDDLNEYLNWQPHPPIMCSKEKFVEYEKLYKYVSKNSSIQLLHDNGIVPEYITTQNDALIFLYFEYEIKDKTWKKNRRSFDIIKHQL